ncbi:MAG: hypothetical protein HUJ97_08030 [Bacteroidales bacterium]|nr:hypothetical protein [Bacteroidales bacterium]
MAGEVTLPLLPEVETVSDDDILYIVKSSLGTDRDNKCTVSKIAKQSFAKVRVSENDDDPGYLKDKLPHDSLQHTEQPVYFVEHNGVLRSVINDKAVSEDNIDDLAVTTEKIAEKNVTTEKIADKAITNDKIGDQAVTVGKLCQNSVSSEKIQPNAVTSEKIAGYSVKNDHIDKDSQMDFKSVVTEKVDTNELNSARVNTSYITLSGCYLASALPNAAFSTPYKQINIDNPKEGAFLIAVNNTSSNVNFYICMTVYGQGDTLDKVDDIEPGTFLQIYIYKEGNQTKVCYSKPPHRN